VGNSRGF